jgi:hypothetical protein
MDDVEKDLCTEYADKLQDILIHLVKNKTICDETKNEFLIRYGTELFKIGHAKHYDIDSDILDNHHLMFIPKAYSAEIEDFSQSLQNKYLAIELDIRISKARSTAEVDSIIKEFKRQMSGVGVEYDEAILSKYSERQHG